MHADEIDRAVQNRNTPTYSTDSERVDNAKVAKRVIADRDATKKSVGIIYITKKC
jgi:hypothetical protein